MFGKHMLKHCGKLIGDRINSPVYHGLRKSTLSMVDDIVNSHLEALAKIKQLENEIEKRDRVTPTTW